MYGTLGGTMRRYVTGLVWVALLLPMSAEAADALVTPTLRTGLIWESDDRGSVHRDAFTLARSELGAVWQSGSWKATATGEWVRSATAGSLMGVAGNSYLLRPREMAVQWNRSIGNDWAIGAAGGVLLLPSTRSFSSDPLAGWETSAPQRIFGDDASDIGFSIGASYGAVAETSIALTNGEGSRDVERNGEKNLSASIRVSPAGETGVAGFRPKLEGSFLTGTFGSGSQTMQRAEATLSVGHYAGTARVTYGQGEGSTRLADATSSWLRATIETAPIIGNLSVVSLGEQITPDEEQPGTTSRAGVGLRWRGAERDLTSTLTVWYAYEAADEEAASVPGAASASEGSRLLFAVTVSSSSEETASP